MKVAELIEKLKAMPQDLAVLTRDEHDGYTSVEEVQHITHDEYGDDPHVLLSEYGFRRDE